jgi:hypothetical protein
MSPILARTSPHISLYTLSSSPWLFPLSQHLDPTRKTKKMENDLKKSEKWKMTSTKLKIEDNLNFKAVLSSLFNNKNLKNKWF